jgi:hypothetical protein
LPHAGNEIPPKSTRKPIQQSGCGATRLASFGFLSVCPEFEELQETNFLEMNFTELAEFFVMQLGYESLEECYERFVYPEPYGLASVNAAIERLRLGAIAGGGETHDAILAHLAAFQIPSIRARLKQDGITPQES